MRKILSTIAVIAALGGSASAADLPSYKTVSPPVNQFLMPYVGVVGGVLTNGGSGVAGIQYGYDFEYVRFEADYDRLGTGKYGSNAWSGNVIAQLPYKHFVPYALAGGGYTYGPNGTSPIWVVGGGLRYEFNDRLAVDARYRYMGTTQSLALGTTNFASVVTLGAQYQF